MKTFPDNITFKYPWRKYQQRVLDELENHLDDNHLHVIAPPGSGKTVLGLEVMLRLNKPTLILAPTIAIRNQWVDRFCEMFLKVDQRPDWISNNIKNPGQITVSTYQGLHAACSDSKVLEDELEETNNALVEEVNSLEKVCSALKRINLGTIIIDEAHHLKNVWWKSLIQIKDKLKTTTVGLTATPPYDVSYAEWSRYLALNGPVDTEISVPELIREGDLCPHQDYIMISEPTETEKFSISKQRQKTNDIFVRLSKDAKVVEHLSSSSLIKSPKHELDWIYNNIAYYSSILIFLNYNKVLLSKYHFKITGNKASRLPDLSKHWLETLMEYYLFKFESQDEDVIHYQKEVMLALRKAGHLDRQKVNFSDDSKIEHYLKSSLGKLDSINKITEFEHNQLNSHLRQVILSDYVRKEYLSDTVEINKLGVIPIFESLRRRNSNHLKLGVLTGSLVIIPVTALGELIRVAGTYNLNITTKSLTYDSNYLAVDVNTRLRGLIVYLVTQIFESGEISVLIGTKSLLGEGWDAPSINVLILASFVGSFVLSNQMRGRAIRTQKGNNEKTGNIWHLLCADPTSSTGGKDFVNIERRFKSFIGISERKIRSIENGIDRLLIPKVFDKNSIQEFNLKMLSSAAERTYLREQWRQAIDNGISLVEEIKIPFDKDKDYKKVKKLYFNKTIQYVLIELTLGLTLYANEFIYQLPRFKSLLVTQSGRYEILSIFLIGAFLLFGIRLLKVVKLFLKYRDISKDIDSIGKTVLQTLVDTNHIQTDASKLKIETVANEYGEVYCHLEGGTTYEKSLFIKSLQEIVFPVDNPRYLIIRKNLLFNFLNQVDYHSVPELFGKHKTLASQLTNNWNAMVGRCALVFTKSIEGRAILLKARFNSLASEFQEKAERTSRWR